MHYLSVALDMASQAHAKQRDWNGDPYIFHAIRVERRVAQNLSPISQEGRITARIVALLHDVMPTKEFTWTQIRQAFGSWGKDVELSLIALTPREHEKYEEHIERIINWGSIIVLMVALADIEDNLDFSLYDETFDEKHMLYVTRLLKAKERLDFALRKSLL